ncbi:MAG: DUF4159 domain-containing protein [Gemmatimonadetes bacterium]|nr:DUF4159 domain-containing protein [Gemmatimonadota bacterium]
MSAAASTARREGGRPAGSGTSSTLPRLLLCGALLSLAGAVAAQVPPDWGRSYWRPGPLRQGLPVRQGGVDRGFTFCRLLYTSVRREANGRGWGTDYPMADNNFMVRLSELTTTRTSRWEDGEPGYAVLRATDANLFECPFLFVSDAGTAGFSDQEVARLREYLLKGGFLWADDFWGERAWAHWVGQIKRVLPGYGIVDLTPGHPLFSTLYHVGRIPQIPSIQFWRRSGGETSERGRESVEPHLRAIFDDQGRLVVLMSHNTDVADGWEREGEDDRFFYAFSPEAYALGINVAIWAMTH